MAYGFRRYALEQAYLLPVAPREWVGDGHLVLFLHEVVSELDLAPIYKEYTGGRGPKGYHPQLLLEVLLYGYCTGTFSSRKLAARCETDVPMLVLANGQRPDFRTLATFRKRHLSALQKLFVQVLRLCREAGLVKAGHLSLDGSKYAANASKHKAMSYGRIQASEPALVAEIQALLKRATETDAAEDAEYGPDVRGDELPEELRRREGRLAKIREAKARLEERAEERARERAVARGASDDEIAATMEAAVPGEKEQSNFTDPDSRIMKTKSGWAQGYNAQIVVEEDSGIIVACEVSAHAADSPRLAPMLAATETNLAAIGLIGVPDEERTPTHFTADAGYCSEKNLALLAARGIDAYVATGRERHRRRGVDPHGTPSAQRTPLRAAMRTKLQTPEGRAVYARRKCITEPVHGLIKQARGFRQFLLRGLANVQAEFALVALTHNLLKLWRAGHVGHPGRHAHHVGLA
ncbi:MAG TPA: IS1182 family transposase [Gemmatimonadaceae bacterium]|nr:IS1182 family transposase [Gemmatimonadaceae bacterium]